MRKSQVLFGIAVLLIAFAGFVDICNTFFSSDGQRSAHLVFISFAMFVGGTVMCPVWLASLKDELHTQGDNSNTSADDR